MSARVRAMDVPDDEWEEAAVEQLRKDLRDYPGGVKAFVKANRDRLGIGYDALNANLNGETRIAYRTFMRAVAILGYTTQQYEDRITQLIEANRRRQAEED